MNTETLNRPPDTLIEKDGKFYVKPFWITGPIKELSLNVPVSRITQIRIGIYTIDFFCYYYETPSLCRHTIIENMEENMNLLRKFQNKETT